MARKLVAVTVRLPPVVHELLTKVARDNGMSLSQYMREAAMMYAIAQHAISAGRFEVDTTAEQYVLQAVARTVRESLCEMLDESDKG